MTLVAGVRPDGLPTPAARDLIERYHAEALAPRLDPVTADRYRGWLGDVLAGTGEAGLLTADPALAAAFFRATGRPQDRWKAIRIGAVLEDFRQWVAGH